MPKLLFPWSLRSISCSTARVGLSSLWLVMQYYKELLDWWDAGGRLHTDSSGSMTYATNCTGFQQLQSMRTPRGFITLSQAVSLQTWWMWHTFCSFWQTFSHQNGRHAFIGFALGSQALEARLRCLPTGDTPENHILAMPGFMEPLAPLFILGRLTPLYVFPFSGQFKTFIISSESWIRCTMKCHFKFCHSQFSPRFILSLFKCDLVKIM